MSIFEKYGFERETHYCSDYDNDDILIELESRVLERAAELAEKRMVHGSQLEDLGIIIAEEIRALKEKQ